MKKRLAPTALIASALSCCLFYTNSAFAEVKTSILPTFTTEDGSMDLGALIGMIISILTGLLVIAAVVGLIICGVMWMTARDNERQVLMAKKRISEIVVGIAAWVLLALVAGLIIPRKPDDIQKNIDGEVDLGLIKKPEEKKKTEDKTTAVTTPTKPLDEQSTAVPCADGTTDLGTTSEAYSQGKQVTIRLCSIPTIKQSSSIGDGKDDGNIHVNSRVSSAYYALGKKYKDLYGKNLRATQSFRTMAKQEYFYNCYKTKKCNNGNLAAKPGYSNHQLGTAVDFEMEGSGWSKSGVSGFFYKYLSGYGLDRPLTIEKVGDNEDEPWHVAPK